MDAVLVMCTDYGRHSGHGTLVAGVCLYQEIHTGRVHGPRLAVQREHDTQAVVDWRWEGRSVTVRRKGQMYHVARRSIG
jgi:hypothetical protein